MSPLSFFANAASFFFFLQESLPFVRVCGLSVFFMLCAWTFSSFSETGYRNRCDLRCVECYVHRFFDGFSRRATIRCYLCVCVFLFVLKLFDWFRKQATISCYMCVLLVLMFRACSF